MKRAIEVVPSGESVSVPSPLLSTDGLADHLKCSTALLVKWRARGDGPPWVLTKYGIRYRIADVEAWRAATEVVGAKMESRRRGQKVSVQ